jgi:hypothetical protein
MVVYYCEYCMPREEIVRERRGSYNGCVVGCIASFFLDNKKEGPGNFSGDIDYTG